MYQLQATFNERVKGARRGKKRRLVLRCSFVHCTFVTKVFVTLVYNIVNIFIITHRASFFARALSRVNFSNTSFNIFTNVSPLSKVLLFAYSSTLLVNFSNRGLNQHRSSVDIFSNLFLKLKVLFLSLSGGRTGCTADVLFKDVIKVGHSDVSVLIKLDVFLLLIVFLLFGHLTCGSFSSRNTRCGRHFGGLVSVVFLVVLTLAVDVATRVINSLLVFILLAVPTSTTGCFTRALGGVVILGFLFTLFKV